MKSVTPRLTLGLLLLTAAAILAGGVLLSRHTEVRRTPGDRKALQQFAGDLQRELRRLEDVHEQHLLGLAKTANEKEILRTREDCEAITGVVECSFLPRHPEQAGSYVRVRSVSYGAYSRPTFEKAMRGRPAFVLLDPGLFFDEPEKSGWIEEKGMPLLYWYQRSASTLVMVTVEPQEVRKAMSEWIEQWLPAHLPSLHAGEKDEGSKELIMPEGRHLPLGTGAKALEEPHWSQPLPTRYGTWSVASWDKIETQVSHDVPTLAVATGLAVLVAFLGVFVFVQQQRALRLAALQVSFVNRVSHELRTPLTNMLLNLDIVADAMPEEAGKVRPRLELVREEAGRLSRLIENVLSFSKRPAKGGGLHAVECRPRAVVDGIAAQFASAFERRGISCAREHEGEDAPLLMDGDALAQITANLLSNVEKYAPHAAARIVTKQQDGAFLLTVRDEGPGIPESDAERIFEPFTRLDDRVNQGVTGTGLGLAIARELAQRMGGTLRLLQAPLAIKGAAFELCLAVASTKKTV